MKKQLVILFSITALMLPSLSQAAPFSVVGPRALGMGGASVASVNDSTAVYWNPAALADYRKVDIRVPVEAGMKDHIGLEDKWNRINDIYSLVQAQNLDAATEMRQLVLDLDRPDTGADVDASVGLLISIPIAKTALAVSALSLGHTGVYPTVDTLHVDTTIPPGPNYIANNNTAATAIGILVQEPAISFAASFGETFFIGATAKKMYAETYVNSQKLTSNSFDTFLDELENSKTESDAASVDAGILIAPIENFRIGLVGRYLNSPSFPVEGKLAQKEPTDDVTIPLIPTKGEIEFEPQYRAGIAWKPFQTLTLAVDYDLSKNKTLTPGYESQTAAIGLEKTFFSEYFNLRVGANQNMADSSAKRIYTAGLGLRLFALRVDLAAGYDFDERQGDVSANLALRF